MVEMVNTKFERYFVQPLLAAAWLPDKYSAGAAPLTPPVEADNKMKSLSNKRQGGGERERERGEGGELTLAAGNTFLFFIEDGVSDVETRKISSPCCLFVDRNK